MARQNTLSGFLGWIPENILPWKAGVAILCILGLAAVFQFLIHNVILDNTKVWAGECESTGWNLDGAQLVLDLSCNGEKARNQNGEVLLSYIKNPGPLECQLFLRGETNCKERPSLKPEKS